MYVRMGETSFRVYMPRIPEISKAKLSAFSERL